MDPATGLLLATGIGVALEGGMTAAAFVGSVKINKDGEAEITEGAAKIHEFNIVGIEEFAEITNMMKQAYNVQMADALLTALDKGWVRKRLARTGRKGIIYPTQITLWTGSQPTRIELASGLGRRFFPLENIPNRRERKVIADMRRAGRGLYLPPEDIREIKNELEEILAMAKDIKRITFGQDFDEYLINYGLIHYEAELFGQRS